MLSFLETVTFNSSDFDRELSFNVPVIVALPGASALITPFSSTVATDVSSESHTISVFSAFSGVKRTFIAYSSPFISSMLVWNSSISSTIVALFHFAYKVTGAFT